MPTIEEIIRDKKNWPDDLTVPIVKDGQEFQVSLRDLRKPYESFQADYTRKTQSLAEERALLERRAQEIQQQMESVNNYLASQQQAAPMNTPSNDPADELWSLFAPKVTPLQNELQQVKQAYQQLANEYKTTVQQMAQNYVQDRLRDRYQYIKDVRRPEWVSPEEMPSLEELSRFSVENKIFDDRNIPDIDRSLERMLSDKKERFERSRIEQEAIKNYEIEKKREAIAGRPGFSDFGKTAPTATPAAQGTQKPLNARSDNPLRDALRKATQDSDILSQLTGR